MSKTKAAPPDPRPRHRVWLTLPDVLAELRADCGTFDHWRRRGVGPRMKKLPNGSWHIRGDWFDSWLATVPGEGDDAEFAARPAATGRRPASSSRAA